MTANLTPRRVPETHPDCYVFQTGAELARYAAKAVVNVIEERNALGHKAVLGLPTGSTPVGVYRELIRLHKNDGLDLSQVITFNLDEYYGVDGEQLQSVGRKGAAEDVLPLDAFRTEFMGHNWGVPAELLHYRSGPFKRFEAVSRFCTNCPARGLLAPPPTIRYLRTWLSL